MGGAPPQQQQRLAGAAPPASSGTRPRASYHMTPVAWCCSFSVGPGARAYHMTHMVIPGTWADAEAAFPPEAVPPPYNSGMAIQGSGAQQQQTKNSLGAHPHPDAVGFWLPAGGGAPRLPHTYFQSSVASESLLRFSCQPACDKVTLKTGSSTKRQDICSVCVTTASQR